MCVFPKGFVRVRYDNEKRQVFSVSLLICQFAVDGKDSNFSSRTEITSHKLQNLATGLEEFNNQQGRNDLNLLLQSITLRTWPKQETFMWALTYLYTLRKKEKIWWFNKSPGVSKPHFAVALVIVAVAHCAAHKEQHKLLDSYILMSWAFEYSKTESFFLRV